jgi:hypothetical protein
MADLAERLVQAATLALIPTTPADDYARQGARDAAVAVLRVLVADHASLLSPARRSHFEGLALEIERIANEPGIPVLEGRPQ